MDNTAATSKVGVKDAKEAAKKHIKSVDDAKKFVTKNKAKIDEVSKHLKGKDKENFDKIVSMLSSNKLNESDLGVKTICGLVSVITWLLGFPTVALVAAAPVYGPILASAVGKLTDLRESVEESQACEEEELACESATVHDEDISDDMWLELSIPGTDGVSINMRGDWQEVRFAVDMVTDALSHMKAKDPQKYEGVELHVRRD